MRPTGRVFHALTPLDPARVIFGQYDGYRREPGVAADSTVETFAALTVEVDNRRWAGVPFQLRTGKALARTTGDDNVHFQGDQKLARTETGRGRTACTARLQSGIEIGPRGGERRREAKQNRGYDAGQSGEQ